MNYKIPVAIAGSVLMAVILLAKPAAERGMYGGPLPSELLETVTKFVAVLWPVIVAVWPEIKVWREKLQDGPALLRKLADLLEKLLEETKAQRVELAQARDELKQERVEYRRELNEYRAQAAAIIRATPEIVSTRVVTPSEAFQP